MIALLAVAALFLGVAVWAVWSGPRRCDIACPMCESANVWRYKESIVCYDCGHVTNCLE